MELKKRLKNKIKDINNKVSFKQSNEELCMIGYLSYLYKNANNYYSSNDISVVRFKYKMFKVSVIMYAIYYDTNLTVVIFVDNFIRIRSITKKDGKVYKTLNFIHDFKRKLDNIDEEIKHLKDNNVILIIKEICKMKQ